ncbi:hypothetical protein IFR05_000176 [Cadophora sp. M221]|nr:hypothetical protein IFR05_000176 [Cadophora sp. M221]
MAHLRKYDAVVGIDLGTSNCCIAVFRNDKVEIIPNEHGDLTTPSCVSFTDNERIIGLAAKNRSVLDHAGTIWDIKRLVGRRFADPVTAQETRRLPFRIIEKLGRPAVEVQFKGRTRVFTPEQISAMILGKLKAMTEQYLGVSSEARIGCVVTVPSAFNVCQRQSTMDACTIAGFHVFRTVPEPTAAAFAYNLSTKGRSEDSESLYLVLDMGGGTLGVTVLDILDMTVSICATAGNNNLGGADFDDKLMNYLADDFDSIHDTNIRSNPRAMSRLRLAAERAKCVLSSATQTVIEIESLHKGKDYSRLVTRSIFETCCKSLFQSIIPALDDALRSPSYQKDKISEVILVGGSTRIPAIQELVSKYFDGKELKKSINPDESAASGASIIADILSANPKSKISDEMLLVDAVSASIQLYSDVEYVRDSPPSSTNGRTRSTPELGTMVVPKGNPFPTRKVLTVRGTLKEDQDTVKLYFYEGDMERSKDNLLLCELELTKIPPAPSGGHHEFEVSVHIDSNYDMEFSIKERTSRRKATKKVERSVTSLSASYLETMATQEATMRREDATDFERAILKSTLESEAYLLEEKLERLKLMGNISDKEEERFPNKRTLRWLKTHPRADLTEYQTRLEEIRNVASVIARSTLDTSVESSTRFPDTRFTTQTGSQHRRDQSRDSSDFQTSISSATVTPNPSAASSMIELLCIRERSSSIEQPKTSPAQVPADLTQIPAETIILPSPASGVTSRIPSPAMASVSSASVSPPSSIQSPNVPTPSRSSSGLSLEGRLSQFFASRGKDASYTDQDMQDISSFLLHMDRQAWSTIPRIYAVLRTTGDLQLIDNFTELGITDIWFPFSITSLPENLPPSARARFIDAQSIVLTMALELEKGTQGRHVNFGHGDFVPYEVLARLGSGGYGYVDKVISTISHQEHARKVFRRKKVFSKHREDIKNFKNELAILKRVSHQHCVELIGSYTDPKNVALIMSPVADCNLATYFTDCASSRDKLSLLRSFFGCLANALSYLHASKIRHRDIKPENILVKGSLVLLTDFGLSFDWEHLSRSTTTADVARTPVYAAPEVAEFGPRKNSAADVWSLGCVFLEMLTVLRGFAVADLRAFFKSKNETYRYCDNVEAALEWATTMVPAGAQEDGMTVLWIKKMMNRDPAERITAAALFGEILDGGERAGFCGPCCGGEEDDDSDGTWDDREAWSDTEEVTVKPT